MNRPDEITLARVVEQHRAGSLAEARRLCEAFLALNAESGDGHMWLGLIAMQERRWIDAIAALERALSIRVEPWSLTNLGSCYAKVGRLERAEWALRGAIEMKPDLDAAHVALAAVLHGVRRFDDALTHLHATGAPDAHHEFDARRGCTLAELERYDEAQAAFMRSAEKAKVFTYPRLIAFDRATYEHATTSAPRIAPPQIAYERRGADDVRGVVLISCNPPYVRKYAFAFIRSYAEHERDDHVLHVHVFDPDAAIVEEVQSVADAARVRRLVITTEATGYRAEAAAQRKAYYACGRLIHMSHWLGEYRAPVLALDVDMIVTEPLGRLFAAAQSHDMALNPREPIDAPWLDVIANVVVANPTQRSREFFSAVATYALMYIEREPEAWLVDQTALYCVMRMFRRFGVSPSVRWLEDAHRNVFWHIGHGYDHLLEDERYRRYQGA